MCREMLGLSRVADPPVLEGECEEQRLSSILTNTVASMAGSSLHLYSNARLTMLTRQIYL